MTAGRAPPARSRPIYRHDHRDDQGRNLARRRRSIAQLRVQAMVSVAVVAPLVPVATTVFAPLASATFVH